MFTPQAENYYTRLGIQQESQEREIKAAFLKAVRKFPPEQDPENFKQIREAYDTLINSQTRQEYDSRLDFGPEIEILENQIKDASEENNLDEEIRLLKKLLNIAPDMSIYRNMLGLVFLENEEPDHAFSQFKKASTLSPDNHIFVLNMGHAEEARDNFKKAESLFIQAGKMEDDDYSPPRALAGLYFFRLEEKSKAYSVLEDAIQADGKLDFRDLFCIWDKLHFCIWDDEVEKLDAELERILEIAQNEEERQFALYLLKEPLSQLYEVRNFELVVKLADCARKLDPTNDALEEFYQTNRRNRNIFRSFENIMKQHSVHDFVKHMISIYIRRYFNEIEDDDWIKESNEISEVVDNIIATEPDSSKIKKSLRYIKQNHAQLFSIQEELFNLMINAPKATQLMGKCPHCSKPIIVSEYDYSNYICTSCQGGITYSLSGFSKVSYSSQSSSDCFIATAVYGDSLHPDVEFLRYFRDEKLLRSKLGRASIELYYRYAPSFANKLSPHPRVCMVLRIYFLESIVKLLQRLVRV
jgi:curved DNA-binding protein CbpA